MEICGCVSVLPSSGVSVGCACGISDGVAEGPASVEAERTLALGAASLAAFLAASLAASVGGGGISVGFGISGGGGISGGVGIGGGGISGGVGIGGGGISAGAGGSRNLTPIFCLTLGGENAALTLGGERVSLGGALAERGRRVTVVQPWSGSSFMTCSTSSSACGISDGVAEGPAASGCFSRRRASRSASVRVRVTAAAYVRLVLTTMLLKSM